MGDRKRKLGSREAFAVPRIGDGVPFALPLANGMFESPIKAPENVPYSGKGYISTPEKSYSASISNNELAELYSSCIKLATENLNLIDYMEDVLEQEASGDNPNFQAASCTLDASVKIYSCRVDSVHSDTYKVLGGLNRTEREIEEHPEAVEETVEVAPTADEPENARKRKSRKINPGSVNTIEPNIEALNAKKGDIAFMVDPLFRKTSAAFDQGGVKGLLLNHLEVQEGCALVFDSADAVDLSNQATIVPDTDCCIAELYELLAQGGGVDNINDLDICPTFSNFMFEEGPPVRLDHSKDDESEESISSDEDFALDVDFSGAASDPSFVADSSMDKSIEMPDNYAWVESGLATPNINLKVVGADHWQYASVKTERTDAKSKPRKKKAKKEFFIDFLASPPSEDLFASPGKKCNITLPDSVWDKAPERLTTMAKEHPYDIAKFSQLFNRPLMMGHPLLGYSAGSEDEHESPSSLEVSSSYDDSFNEGYQVPERKLEMQREEKRTEGEETSQGDEEGNHLLLQGGAREGGEEQTKDDAAVEPTADVASQNGEMDGGGGEVDRLEAVGGRDDNGGMVQEPQRVTVEAVKYAKVASKTNVKELKDLMWNELQSLLQGRQERDEEEVEFGTVLGKMSTRMKEKEIGEVSTAMCFICALHLCNEKGLSLSQQDIDHLIISEAGR